MIRKPGDWVTAAELDTLPPGTVIRELDDGSGPAVVYERRQGWLAPGCTATFEPVGEQFLLLYLPRGDRHAAQREPVA